MAGDPSHSVIQYGWTLRSEVRCSRAAKLQWGSGSFEVPRGEKKEGERGGKKKKARRKEELINRTIEVNEKRLEYPNNRTSNILPNLNNRPNNHGHSSAENSLQL